jgi:hypothetical protein
MKTYGQRRRLDLLFRDRLGRRSSRVSSNGLSSRFFVLRRRDIELPAYDMKSKMDTFRQAEFRTSQKTETVAFSLAIAVSLSMDASTHTKY